MVQFCCVVGCGNRSNRERMKFFRLPNIPKTLNKSSAKALLISKRRSQWLLNISRIDLKDGDSAYSPGYIRVCSDHFYSGKPSELTDVDNADWAPTLKMGHSNVRMKGSRRKRAMLGFPTTPRKRKKSEDDDVPLPAKKKRRRTTETVQKKKVTQAKKTVQRTAIKKEWQVTRQVTTLKNVKQAKKTIVPAPVPVPVPVKRQIYQIPIYVQDDKPYKSPFIHKITAECIVPDTNNFTVKSSNESEQVMDNSNEELQVKEEHDLNSDVKVEPDLSIIKDEPVI